AAAGDGLGRRVRQGRDRGSAAAVSGGVGQRHAVLCGRGAGGSPLLLCPAPDAPWSVAGGAARGPAAAPGACPGGPPRPRARGAAPPARPRGPPKGRPPGVVGWLGPALGAGTAGLRDARPFARAGVARGGADTPAAG